MSLSIKVYPPPRTVESVIAEYVANIDIYISYLLVSGFGWTPPADAILPGSFPEGEPIPELWFSTKMTDQANFADASTGYLVAVIMQNTAYIQPWQGWLGNKQYTILLNLTSYRTFGERYAAHKMETLGRGWTYKNLIRQCTSVAEIETTYAQFEIPDEEMIKAKSMISTGL